MQIIRQREIPDTGVSVSRMSVNSSRLERWLGKSELDRISDAMLDWKGPPIAVAGVPGRVYAYGGGDFRGELRAGFEATLADRALDYTRRIMRAARIGSRRNRLQLNAGFSSLSDMVSEATQGNKQRKFYFNKVGTTGAIAATNTLWFVSGQPTAGANAAAAPGGTAWTDASTGAIPFTNPTGGDTQHLVSAFFHSSQTGTNLLYDRLFSVTKTMNSTGTEAVTGVPTRYQSTTQTDADYAGGNFLIIECRTALPATAHNWTTCLYTDQDGNTGATLPSVTGNSSCIINRLDQPINTIGCPLASGDTGIKALTQMQCSALVASGAIDFTIGHPIAWMPQVIGSIGSGHDFLNTAFSLTRIFDDACLSLLEVLRSGATAQTITCEITTLAG
jgi:hypothetical protein